MDLLGSFNFFRDRLICLGIANDVFDHLGICVIVWDRLGPLGSFRHFLDRLGYFSLFRSSETFWIVWDPLAFFGLCRIFWDRLGSFGIF